MIRTIQRKNGMTVGDFAGLEPHRRIYATDFYVQGAEAWTVLPGERGLMHPRNRLVNVDHHAPIPCMQRPVTSTMLAINLVGTELRPDPDRDVVVVNHMDCDTVLASGILSGRLDADERFAEASRAADHTGKEDEIADLLQGLDARWSRLDRPVPDPKGMFDFFEDLDRLLEGRPPSDFARAAMDERKRSHETAERLVSAGRFEGDDGVVLATLDERIEGELVLPFLPDAVVVVIATRSTTLPRPWRMKVRLGLAAPDGLSLHDLRIREDIDPRFGGRWNAGSNGAGGGTDIPPEEYRAKLAEALRRWLS